MKVLAIQDFSIQDYNVYMNLKNNIVGRCTYTEGKVGHMLLYIQSL